jgi:hypothetical protein
MKPVVMVAVFGCGLASAAHAQSFESGTRLPVNPVSATQFEVIEADSAGGAQMWCAAATYSNDVLGRYEKTDISVLSPRGPSVTATGRNGVVFTIDQASLDEAPSTAYSATINRAGVTFAVSMALTFCDDEGEVN